MSTESGTAHDDGAPFVCEPDDAIRRLSEVNHGQHVILDFDETLFLRNSTEEYLDSIRPRFLAALVLFALSALKPWLWFPGVPRGEGTQDWFRIVTLSILFPWSAARWRARSAAIAASMTNHAIGDALQPNGPIIVASNGYRFVIEPVLEKMGVPYDQLVAIGFWSGARDRSRGKVKLLDAAIGQVWRGEALVISDSLDDLEKLRLAGQGCLTRWPAAEYRRAMSSVYVPFLYTHRVKQPGQGYLLKTVLAEDLAFVILATSWIQPSPLLHALSMAWFMASFWCIYELGYAENDLVAARLEADPKLSEAFEEHRRRISLWAPWPWAIAFAVPGAILLHVAEGGFDGIESTLRSTGTTLLWWVALLFALRLTYALYNYANKAARIWIYPVLQGYKTFGFLAITSVGPVGALLFAAQIIARWVLYITYRLSGGRWRPIGQVLRVCFFTILVAAVTLSTSWVLTRAEWIQAGVIFAYASLKAQRELRGLMSDLGWLRSARRDGRAEP
ncbi:MAG: HAD family hydrolase [Myxococcota bacterium]